MKNNLLLLCIALAVALGFAVSQCFRSAEAAKKEGYANGAVETQNKCEARLQFMGKAHEEELLAQQARHDGEIEQLKADFRDTLALKEKRRISEIEATRKESFNMGKWTGEATWKMPYDSICLVVKSLTVANDSLIREYEAAAYNQSGPASPERQKHARLQASKLDGLMVGIVALLLWTLIRIFKSPGTKRLTSRF